MASAPTTSRGSRRSGCSACSPIPWRSRSWWPSPCSPSRWRCTKTGPRWPLSGSPAVSPRRSSSTTGAAPSPASSSMPGSSLRGRCPSTCSRAGARSCWSRSSGIGPSCCFGYSDAARSVVVPVGGETALQAGVLFGWISLWLVPTAREALRSANPRRWPVPEIGAPMRLLLGDDGRFTGSTPALVVSFAAPLISLSRRKCCGLPGARRWAWWRSASRRPTGSRGPGSGASSAAGASRTPRPSSRSCSRRSRWSTCSVGRPSCSRWPRRPPRCTSSPGGWATGSSPAWATRSSPSWGPGCSPCLLAARWKASTVRTPTSPLSTRTRSPASRP